MNPRKMFIYATITMNARHFCVDMKIFKIIFI